MIIDLDILGAIRKHKILRNIDGILTVTMYRNENF